MSTLCRGGCRRSILLALLLVAALPASARPTGDALPPGVAASFRTPGAPGHVSVGFGSVWVSTHRGNVLYRIDPSRSRITRRILLPFNACLPMTIGSGRLWVTRCGDALEQTAEVDPQRNTVTAVRQGSPRVFGEGGVWTIRRGELLRLDSRTGNVVGRVKVPVGLITVGYGSVWVSAEEGVVTRVDPRSMQVVAAIPLPNFRPPHGREADGGYQYGGYAALAAGAVWVTGGRGLYRIDPATNRVTRTEIGVRGFSEWGDICIVAAARSLWVRTSDTKVARVNPATGKVVRRYPAAGGGGCMAVGFRAIWVANFIDDTVWRIPIDG